MRPGVAIADTRTALPGRQSDGATATGTMIPFALVNPGAVGCTQSAAKIGQEGEKSFIRATSNRAVPGNRAAGLAARGDAVECQLIIESACIGNIDETASTGEGTVNQAAAVARTPWPVEIEAEANIAQGCIGDPKIIDARMTGPAHIVVLE